MSNFVRIIENEIYQKEKTEEEVNKEISKNFYRNDKNILLSSGTFENTFFYLLKKIAIGFLYFFGFIFGTLGFSYILLLLLFFNIFGINIQYRLIYSFVFSFFGNLVNPEIFSLYLAFVIPFFVWLFGILGWFFYYSIRDHKDKWIKWVVLLIVWSLPSFFYLFLTLFIFVVFYKMILKIGRRIGKT